MTDKEKNLVTGCIAGDKPSWDAFVEQYSALVYHRNLKTMPKVEALRQAQLAMIRGTGTSDLLARRGVGGIGKFGETPVSATPSQNSVSTSHPYFWAPFILVGDGK